MNIKKDLLLSYGLSKGYYTPKEVEWCLQGNNIKDIYEPAHKITPILIGDNPLNFNNYSFFEGNNELTFYAKETAGNLAKIIKEKKKRSSENNRIITEEI